MKRIIILFICALLFSASTCNKEGGDCHYAIKIINNSNNKVIWAIAAEGIYGCNLDGKELNPGSIGEFLPYNFCIEESLLNGQTENIFIVNPDHFNDPNIYYSCDSIEYKNEVLKHFVLTLEDLKQNDFTVTYY